MKELRDANSLKVGAAGSPARRSNDLGPRSGARAGADDRSEARGGCGAARAAPAKFVQGEEDQWLANTEKFTEATGVHVRSRARTGRTCGRRRRLRPTSAAARTSSMGWYDDPHQYPTSSSTSPSSPRYLGKKYGGWYDVCRKFGMRDGSGSPFRSGGPGPASSTARPC